MSRLSRAIPSSELQLRWLGCGEALLAWIFSDLCWCGVVVSALDPPPWYLGVGGAFYSIQSGLRWCSLLKACVGYLLLAVPFETLRQRVWSPCFKNLPLVLRDGVRGRLLWSESLRNPTHCPWRRAGLASFPVPSLAFQASVGCPYPFHKTE
ncbi:hypothetical protein HID58_072762 [Brassica napus]|uniref:Uncharacterized protein n=1 Tax=Brassica napus TaxID=3708 RepID=A0ABQ7Z5D0_BRANA|nr:hypothetical protein HID58_072762 [Brassica napus]